MCLIFSGKISQIFGDFFWIELMACYSWKNCKVLIVMPFPYRARIRERDKNTADKEEGAQSLKRFAPLNRFSTRTANRFSRRIATFVTNSVGALPTLSSRQSILGRDRAGSYFWTLSDQSKRPFFYGGGEWKSTSGCSEGEKSRVLSLLLSLMCCSMGNHTRTLNSSPSKVAHWLAAVIDNTVRFDRRLLIDISQNYPTCEWKSTLGCSGGETSWVLSPPLPLMCCSKGNYAHRLNSSPSKVAPCLAAAIDNTQRFDRWPSIDISQNYHSCVLTFTCICWKLSHTPIVNHDENLKKCFQMPEWWIYFWPERPRMGFRNESQGGIICGHIFYSFILCCAIWRDY